MPIEALGRNALSARRLRPFATTPYELCGLRRRGIRNPMDLGLQFLFIGVALVLVFLNGFFVNAEFAIVKVRETRIAQLVQEGSRRAKTAHRLIRNMDEYLSATQLGITLASLGLGWIGEPAFASVFEPVLASVGLLQPALVHTLSAATAFLLITFLHIVLGELAPKSLAIQKPEISVLWTGPPLVLFYRISYPFIWALNGAANLLLKLVGVRPASESELAHSEEEFRLLLANSHQHGVLDRDKVQMLEQVLDFAERSVRQVMVPSVEVKYLDTQKSIEDNLRTARSESHTRFPLCDGSLDKVVGLVNVKDLFRNLEVLKENFSLESVTRQVHFVPESKDIKSLLADFRKTRIHLAVVVDEFGSTAGIVTLEDVLEEIVGEIQDEFDVPTPPKMIRQTLSGQYLVQGRTLVEDIEARLSIELQDEINDTIAGHVMMILGRTARVGDQIPVASLYRVRVVGMKGLQITDLVFEILNS